MLLVKTSVRPSPIEGLGLFAAEFIPKGAHMWKFESGFDQSFTPEQVAAIPEPAHSFMLRYAYVSPATGEYILCGDDSLFFNHADEPNTGEVHVEGEIETRAIALRDIEASEELTIDYRIMEGTDVPLF